MRNACFCMFTYLVIRSTKRPKNESKLTQNEFPKLHQTCWNIQPRRQSEKRRGKREESKETIQIPTKSQSTGKQEEQHPINLGRVRCYGVIGCDHDDDRVLFGVDSNPCDDDGTISEWCKGSRSCQVLRFVKDCQCKGIATCSISSAWAVCRRYHVQSRMRPPLSHQAGNSSSRTEKQSI